MLNRELCADDGDLHGEVVVKKVHEPNYVKSISILKLAISRLTLLPMPPTTEMCPRRAHQDKW